MTTPRNRRESLEMTLDDLADYGIIGPWTVRDGKYEVKAIYWPSVPGEMSLREAETWALGAMAVVGPQVTGRIDLTDK